MSWRFWVNKTGLPFGGNYHFFRNFRVYWAYKLWIRDRIAIEEKTKFRPGIIGCTIINEYKV